MTTAKVKAKQLKAKQMAATQAHRKQRLFSKVHEARELLKAEALDIYEGYKRMIVLAIAHKDFETADKAYRFLIEHIPAEDGVRMIDISVDKPVQVEGQKGPQIQIGIALGGLPSSPKLIETAPIDAQTIEIE